MKKLIAIVAITASVMATPAFAQSFDKDFGSTPSSCAATVI